MDWPLTILRLCVAWNGEENLSEVAECEAFRLGHEVKFPLDENGTRTAMLHHTLQDQDFLPLMPGHPVFRTFDGKDLLWEGEKATYPHFINEAAYHKLDVAFATSERCMF